MLNETIISASHMLTPLWSEQIVKYFMLDFRYCTVFTLLFNGITGMLSFSDKTASIIIFLICGFGSLFVFLKKQTFSLNLMSNKNKQISIVLGYNCEKEIVLERGNNYIEKFLFSNQQYFLDIPNWLSTEVIKTGKDDSNYALSSFSAFLENGNYRVSLNNEIKFVVTVKTNHSEKKLSTRSFSLIFEKGDENALFKFMTNQERIKGDENNGIIYSYPLGVTIGELHCPVSKKGKRSTFFGYYNPKLDSIIQWIDSLNYPSKNFQPRQFSIICHGKSGTGKTAIVKRIAEYTNRNIVLVNLFEIKKKKNLIDLFYSAEGGTEKGFPYYSDIDKTIFFIDEFDKVVRKLKSFLKENKMKKEKLFLMLKTTSQKDDDDEEKDKPDKNDFDWDIDDLLEIFCGSYIPDKRMIILACNDLESITREYPYLVRPGRLTPISFDYGDKMLFKQVVKDYTDLDIDDCDIPDDYKFVHASLIEYLNYKGAVSCEEILTELNLFKPPE